MNNHSRGEVALIQSIGLVSVLTVFLYLMRSALSGGLRVYSYVPINLVLAWLPAIFAWMLVRELKTRRWGSWYCACLSILWLVFLPNAWYVLTDFIHIQTIGQTSRVYDILMFSALALSGLALGFFSLLVVHKELIKRLGQGWSLLLVSLIILAGSFAIYLGRELRWNTWDIVRDPGGLAITVSDRIISPLEYSGTISITVLFFVFLTTVYAAIWISLNGLRKGKG